MSLTAASNSRASMWKCSATSLRLLASRSLKPEEDVESVAAGQLLPFAIKPSGRKVRFLSENSEDGFTKPVEVGTCWVAHRFVPKFSCNESSESDRLPWSKLQSSARRVNAGAAPSRLAWVAVYFRFCAGQPATASPRRSRRCCRTMSAAMRNLA